MATIAITAVFIYFLVEASFRIINTMLPYGIGGVEHGFQEYLEVTQKQLSGSGERADQIDRNVNLGWGENHLITHDFEGDDFSIAVFGDSVTAGAGVDKSDIYTAVLANRLRGAGVKVVNYGVAGYGFDQMLFKAQSELLKEEYDLVIFAYIPHDLIRVGANFMYDLPKPKLEIHSGKVSVKPAEKVKTYYEQYDKAKSNFTFSLWTLKYLWQNREYVMPNFYHIYYSEAYKYLVRNMERLGEEIKAPIMLVKLSNSTQFRGKDILEPLIESISKKNTENDNFTFYDMDDCTRGKVNADQEVWNSTFSFHPGSEGHKIMSECILEFLETKYEFPISGEKMTS